MQSSEHKVKIAAVIVYEEAGSGPSFRGPGSELVTADTLHWVQFNNLRTAEAEAAAEAAAEAERDATAAANPPAGWVRGSERLPLGRGPDGWKALQGFEKGFVQRRPVPKTLVSVNPTTCWQGAGNVDME